MRDILDTYLTSYIFDCMTNYHTSYNYLYYEIGCQVYAAIGCVVGLGVLCLLWPLGLPSLN